MVLLRNFAFDRGYGIGIGRFDSGNQGRCFGGAPGLGGYGLIGMAERAKLLGGSLDAGRGPDGGWRIAAELPRRVAAS